MHLNSGECDTICKTSVYEKWVVERFEVSPSETTNMYGIFTKTFFILLAAWFTILLTRSNHQFRKWILNCHGFFNQFYLILWNCALCFLYSKVWTVRWQECHQSKTISSVCTKTSCSVNMWLSDSNFSAIFLIQMGQLYSFLHHELTPHGLSSLLFT